MCCVNYRIWGLQIIIVLLSFNGPWFHISWNSIGETPNQSWRVYCCHSSLPSNQQLTVWICTLNLNKVKTTAVSITHLQQCWLGKKSIEFLVSFNQCLYFFDWKQWIGLICCSSLWCCHLMATSVASQTYIPWRRVILSPTEFLLSTATAVCPKTLGSHHSCLLIQLFHLFFTSAFKMFW